MNRVRVAAVARKEVFHILRDPFTLALALLFPVLVASIFGLAIEFNVSDIPLAVYDGDRSQASRQLTEAFASSGYFRIDPAHSPEGALRRVDADRDRAALIIDSGFANDARSSRGAEVQVLLDGSDSATVGSVVGYLGQIQRIGVSRITGIAPERPIRLETRFLFNSELSSHWFTVPGLMVVVVGILSILLTSMTVAREWEQGSMELLLSTPIRPIEIVVGKLTPYVGLGFGAVALTYLIARLLFGVPFRGSYVVFLVACGLFLLSYLAMGLLISVVARKQQIAMQASMTIGLLPALLLSGFIFPIESMPRLFYYLTSLLPARWFMQISRDSFLKATPVTDLKLPLAMLGLLSAVLVRVAIRRFKRDLEP